MTRPATNVNRPRIDHRRHANNLFPLMSQMITERSGWGYS